MIIFYPKTNHDIVVPTNANVKIAPRLRKKNLCKKKNNKIEYYFSDYHHFALKFSIHQTLYVDDKYTMMRKVFKKQFFKCQIIQIISNLFHIITSKEYNWW